MPTAPPLNLVLSSGSSRFSSNKLPKEGNRYVFLWGGCASACKVEGFTLFPVESSASADGRILVRKIVKGQYEDAKLIISDQTLLAIQIVGDWDSCHPHVCWHSQIQDVLLVAIGKFVLTIDIGKMRIWGDKTRSLLLSTVPHGREAVSAVAFLSAPHSPDHHVILTASESNEVLHVGAHTEYNGKDEESQPRPRFLDVYQKEESVQVEEGVFLEDRELPMSVLVDIAHEQSRDTAFREAGSVSLPSQISAIAKRRKNKNKTYDGGVEPATAQSSHQLPDLLTPGTMPEAETSYNVNSDPLDPGLAAQVATMQDALNQLVSMQKELHKQMTVMVAVPVAKEGKRMEGALGQRMEKVLKAHVDAMWARLAEESAKREKLERERVQQVTTVLTSFMSKDMPVALERGFKKEFAAIGPAVAQAVLPPLQNVVATTVSESFQDIGHVLRGSWCSSISEV